jgi:hypothetical protein
MPAGRLATLLWGLWRATVWLTPGRALPRGYDEKKGWSVRNRSEQTLDCSGAKPGARYRLRGNKMPELPGIGFEGKADLYAEMKALAG